MKHFLLATFTVLFSMSSNAIDISQSWQSFITHHDFPSIIASLDNDEADFFENISDIVDLTTTRESEEHPDLQQSRRNGWTPLSMALHKKFIRIANDLLERGNSLSWAIKHAIDHDNETALSAVAEYLLPKGIRMSDYLVDPTGVTPYSYALLHDKEKCLSVLVEVHDVQHSDSIQIALRYKNRELISNLQNKNKQATNACLKDLLKNALNKIDTKLLTHIYQTVSTTTIQELLQKLTQEHPAILQKEISQKFQHDIKQRATIEMALENDDSELLEKTLQQGTTLTQEALLIEALSAGATNCTKWLCPAYSITADPEKILQFVEQNEQNKNAIEAYVTWYRIQTTSLLPCTLL